MKLGRRHVKLMGTIIEIVIYHAHPEPILEEVLRRLYQYEVRFSAHRSDSELMAVNRQAGLAPIAVHPELYELIKLGKLHSCASDSYLNIAIGPLTQLWHIGFKDARRPTQSEINARLSLINPEEIALDDACHQVFLNRLGMQLDLGALAKGYIADKLMAYLRQVGVVSALLNLGGNVLTMGPAPHQADGFWRVGIQDPARSHGYYRLVLKVRDQSVVTSGIYERSLRIDNQDYHHIFSSKTGYPISTELASLTILSESSVMGEIWTTRLFGHSPEKITEILANQPILSGIIMMKDGQIYPSQNFL